MSIQKENAPKKFDTLQGYTIEKSYALADSLDPDTTSYLRCYAADNNSIYDLVAYFSSVAQKEAHNATLIRIMRAMNKRTMSASEAFVLASTGHCEQLDITRNGLPNYLPCVSGGFETYNEDGTPRIMRSLEAGRLIKELNAEEIAAKIAERKETLAKLGL